MILKKIFRFMMMMIAFLLIISCGQKEVKDLPEEKIPETEPSEEPVKPVEPDKEEEKPEEEKPEREKKPLFPIPEKEPKPEPEPEVTYFDIWTNINSIKPETHEEGTFAAEYYKFVRNTTNFPQEEYSVDRPLLFRAFSNELIPVFEPSKNPLNTAIIQYHQILLGEDLSNRQFQISNQIPENQPEDEENTNGFVFFTDQTDEEDQLLTVIEKEKFTETNQISEEVTNISETEIDKDIAFIYQRIGICYFKQKKFRKAGIYINRALSLGFENAELYFYKSMLEMYVKGDTNRARSFLLKVSPRETLLFHPQEYWVYMSSLFESSNIQIATGLYSNTIKLDPERFYRNYDLSGFYYSWNMTNSWRNYLERSFENLTNQGENLKAYSQLIDYRLIDQRVQTYQKVFSLNDDYGLHPKLFYYYSFPGIKRRSLSQHFDYPLPEKRVNSSDDVFTAYHESVIDTEHENPEVMILSGIIGLTRVNPKYRSISPSIIKPYIKSNMLVVFSEEWTNVITDEIENNDDTNEVKWELVQNLEVFTNLNFNYGIEVDHEDIDSNGIDDYLIYGFDYANLMKVIAYYPDRDELKQVSFHLDKPDARLVIQDVDGDGSRETLLFDDQLYFLNWKDMK